jgi:hypothetical protein
MGGTAFVLAPEEYKRDIRVLSHYISDAALYLNKMTGKPLEQCIEFVKRQTQPGGKFALVDPKMKMLERGDNGDRVKKLDTLTGYLKKVQQNEEIVTGTFTTYLNPKVKKSLIVDYIDGNIKGRSTAKKEMFAARAAGNTLLDSIKNIEQTGKKLSNNAMSGAAASSSTPLYNRTVHSSLTSNCRITSGYGNANNEKFLSGNRHYWSPHLVVNNIISIINHTDYDSMRLAMDKFGLRHPTFEETMECINYSTSLYWASPKETGKIADLVSRLTPLERSAFVYTGDFYHLMKMNPEFIREFLRKISTRVDVEHPDTGAVIKKSEEASRVFASVLCADYLRGTKLDEIKGTKEYGYYGSTLENINNTIDEYHDFIRAFLVTVNVPASVASFPNSIRRVVVTSDTDSTIFTVQDWVKWYCGEIVFTRESIAISDAMVYMAAQTITHVLARMSANFGIEAARIHQIAMKNEYKFEVFVPTQLGKHYYAVMSSQEGLIFAQLKKEIKGVHLKSSNVPKIVISHAQKMMLFIVGEIMENRKIKLKDLLKEIGDVEREIVQSIKEGGHRFFRKAQVKSPSAYANGEDTPAFKYHLFWNAVFGPKYGIVPFPPYTAIKVNVDLKTPTKTREWMDSLKDRELADRVQKYLDDNQRKHIGSTIFVPEQFLAGNGIPSEITQAVGVRKLIKDTTKVFYIVLETLGIYLENDKITRLVMDEY